MILGAGIRLFSDDQCTSLGGVEFANCVIASTTRRQIAAPTTSPSLSETRRLVWRFAPWPRRRKRLYVSGWLRMTHRRRAQQVRGSENDYRIICRYSATQLLANAA
jgi:hypothetical protein